MKKTVVILLAMVLVAGLMLSGCGSQDETKKEIVVGTKGWSEPFILGEIVKQLVEANSDIAVRTIVMDGGTAMLHPALKAGEIDLYSEYTGTGLLYVLEEELITDPDKCFAKVKEEYLKQFNLLWLDPYSFNNTYALAVSEEFAAKHNLKTYSDLAKVEGVALGAEHDFFERPDGYDALAATYGFDFEKVELPIGLKYQAIGEGKVQVINAFATDGLIKAFNLRVLVDDKNFFPPYHASTVVRNETLEKYPELKDILNKLAGRITDDKMVEMNYKADEQRLDPADIAREFLLNEGLISQ